MPTFAEAQRIVLDNVAPLGAERVPLLEAVDRVLAEDLAAPWDFPAWDHSAMDGFGLRSADAAAGARLRIADYLPAGVPGGKPLQPGTAVRILTGAPIPEGADAVVPLEEAEEQDGVLLLRGPARPEAHVRRRGEDIRAGEVALRAGTVLGPSEISLLASCARLAVPVHRRPRVAVLSTGDELVEAGQPVGPGRIRDSNGPAVAAAVRQAGAEATLLGIAPDEPEALRRLLADGLAADALVTTAGVSAGDRDFVRPVLDSLGVRRIFWQVDIKPGRPTAFGRCGNTPVFSLPGNPVATLLTFEAFVRPALLRMLGHRRVLRPMRAATCQEPLAKRPGRTALVRVRLERRGEALLCWNAGRQETGILRTQVEADGFAVLPSEQGPVAAGATVPVQVLRDDLVAPE